MRKIQVVAVALLVTGVASGCAQGEGSGAAASPASSPQAASSPATSPPAVSDAAPATSRAATGPSSLPTDAGKGYRAFDYGKPLATVSGKLDGKPATLDVLRVRSSASTTALVLRVTVTHRTGFGLDGVGTRPASMGFPDLALVDTVNKKVYRPGRPKGKTLTESWKPTLTSDNPMALGTSPLYVHAIYAPLPAGVASVAVRAGGFPDTTVKVERV